MLIGYLDNADTQAISGWARDTEAPDRRLTLEIFDGDTLITRVVADRPRPDLQSSGVGDGRYGFWVPVPANMLPMSCHVISVRFQENGVDLRNSPCPIYPRTEGIDPAFSGWFNRHATNLARSAGAPEQLAPMIALCSNALSDLLAAQERLLAEGGTTPVSEVSSVELPARMQRLLDGVLENAKPLHVPVFKTPRLTIVIAATGTLVEAHGLVSSIIASNLRDYEIILVDCRASVETLLAPFLMRGGIRFLRQGNAIPVMQAYRLGLASALGEQVLFLSGLARLEPEAIGALLASLDLPGERIVAPLLLAPDGRIAEAGTRYGAMAVRMPRGYLEPGKSSRFRIAAASDDVPLQAFMARKSVLESAGGLDIDPALGEFQLADLCFRLRDKGIPALVQGFAAGVLTDRVTAPSNRLARAAFVTKWQAVLPTAGVPLVSQEKPVALVVGALSLEPITEPGVAILLSDCESLVRMGYAVEFVSSGEAPLAATADFALRIRGIEPKRLDGSLQDHLTARPGQFSVILWRGAPEDALLRHARKTQPMARVLVSLDEEPSSMLPAAVDALVTRTRRIHHAVEAPAKHQMYWSHRLGEGQRGSPAGARACFWGDYRDPADAEAAKGLIEQSWAGVVEACPDARLDIVGPYLEQARIEIVPASVSLRGYIARANEYLDDIRVVVVGPGTSLSRLATVLAAFSRGVPCILDRQIAAELALPAEIQSLLVASESAPVGRKLIRFLTDAQIWAHASALVLGWADAQLAPAHIDKQLRSLLRVAEHASPDAP